MARCANLDIGLERERGRECERERQILFVNLLNIDKCFRYAYLVKKTSRIAPSATSVNAFAVLIYFGFFAALFTREFNIVYK